SAQSGKNRHRCIMLSWFESRLNPYPSAEPVEPPKRFLAFCLHFMSGAKRWLLFMSAASAAIAVLEVSLFGFLGNVVDWLSSVDRETLFETEGARLALMGACIL